jgi:hypothetical protein
MRKLIAAVVLLAALPVTAAHAYIGPGAGAGTIAIVLGILSSVFLAFVGILWYPIKRLLKGRKATPRASAESNGKAKGSGPDGGTPS